MNRAFCAALAAFAIASCAAPSPHEHGAPGADARAAVHFPAPLREHTLANMRDHLDTLEQIQDALARGDFERAAQLSERRLGLSSLEAHGAHEVARYMPPGMQDLGAAMHKAASRFAIEATSASATGDLKAPLAALADVTAQCAACHAAYRLE